MNRPITMSTLIRMLLVSNGLTLLAVVAIVLSTPTFARTLAQITTATTPPATVPYQGTLTDASGTPINDSVAMTFKFYAAPTGGTALWTEQRTGSNAVPVTNGLFSVALGQVTPIPANVLAQPLWLGISVNGDAEMTPREAVTMPAMASRVNQPVLTLLGEKTCSDCGNTVEETEPLPERWSWNTVKGSSTNDPIAVTVTTHGGPVLVHMTARISVDPTTSAPFCAIRVDDREYPLSGIALVGSQGSFACSDSYLITDLPAGTHTFSAQGWLPNSFKVTWHAYRQIAVYEFLSPENQ